MEKKEVQEMIDENSHTHSHWFALLLLFIAVLLTTYCACHGARVLGIKHYKWFKATFNDDEQIALVNKRVDCVEAGEHQWEYVKYKYWDGWEFMCKDCGKVVETHEPTAEQRQAFKAATGVAFPEKEEPDISIYGDIELSIGSTIIGNTETTLCIGDEEYILSVDQNGAVRAEKQK